MLRAQRVPRRPFGAGRDGARGGGGAALAAPAGAVLAAAATASEIDSMVARRETLITVR